MPLPNLIIPGAGKSGTSSLHDYLDQHPDVFMSRPKEPHFFSDDRAFAQGTASYEELFAAAGEARVRGESSTTYMHFPRVPERIGELLGEPRFIFLLRNPVDRVWSHYRWLAGLGQETRPLREAVEGDLDEVPDFAASVGGNYRFYAAESRYGEHLSRYALKFGSARTLVLTTDELRDTPAATLARCAEFLELPPFHHLRSVWTNPTPGGRPARSGDRGVGRVIRGGARRVRRMPLLRDVRARRGRRLSLASQAALSADDRSWLSDLFESDVNVLRSVTGRSFSEWEADFPASAARDDEVGV